MDVTNCFDLPANAVRNQDELKCMRMHIYCLRHLVAGSIQTAVNI